MPNCKRCKQPFTGFPFQEYCDDCIDVVEAEKQAKEAKK